MTTPITRRRWLGSLAALVAAPFAAKLVARSSFPSVSAADTLRSHVEPGSYFVRGLTIKVPSNRMPMRCVLDVHNPHRVGQEWHEYLGDWDGVTFKDEAGCSNPAFVYADLVERSYPGHGPVPRTCWQFTESEWRALHAWGVWCDELVTDWYEQWGPGSATIGGGHTWRPRFTVNAFVHTNAERAALKNDLHMRFLAWKAGDERYRTSWPVYSLAPNGYTLLDPS